MVYFFGRPLGREDEPDGLATCLLTAAVCEDEPDAAVLGWEEDKLDFLDGVDLEDAMGGISVVESG